MPNLICGPKTGGDYQISSSPFGWGVFLMGGMNWVWVVWGFVWCKKKKRRKPMEKKDINSSQKISEELILYWNNV